MMEKISNKFSYFYYECASIICNQSKLISMYTETVIKYLQPIFIANDAINHLITFWILHGQILQAVQICVKNFSSLFKSKRIKILQTN